MTWRHTLLGWTAALLRIDLRETYRTVETVVETEWRDPVDELVDLPDEDGRIYCWRVSSESAGKQLAATLERGFIEKLGREPRALHVILTEEEQLRELDPETFERHVAPFHGGDR